MLRDWALRVQKVSAAFASVTELTLVETARSYALAIEGKPGIRRTEGRAMKNHLTRRRLGAALALAAILLAGAIVVAPKAMTTPDAASTDPYGVDILALDPGRE